MINRKFTYAILATIPKLAKFVIIINVDKYCPVIIPPSFPNKSKLGRLDATLLCPTTGLLL